MRLLSKLKDRERCLYRFCFANTVNPKSKEYSAGKGNIYNYALEEGKAEDA